MGFVEIRPERVRQLLEQADADEPIVMINLLRFRERAEYAAGSDAEPCSGVEAYARYGAAVVPLIRKHGGRPIWRGAVSSTVVSPDGESWHDAVLVEYPSRQAFVDMTSSPEYLAIAPHRTAALADSRLIATKTTMSQLERRARTD